MSARDVHAANIRRQRVGGTVTDRTQETDETFAVELARLEAAPDAYLTDVAGYVPWGDETDGVA